MWEKQGEAFGKTKEFYQACIMKNSCEIAAILTLLIDKGLFTEEEYYNTLQEMQKLNRTSGATVVPLTPRENFLA